MTNDSPPPFKKSSSSDPFLHESTPEGADASESDEFTDPVTIPITDVLDLHTVSARDAEAVVKEYLYECYRLKLTQIRIIHGRGIGVQRAMVRKILEKNDFVISFGDAPMEAGGWGATIVTLRRGDPAELRLSGEPSC